MKDASVKIQTSEIFLDETIYPREDAEKKDPWGYQQIRNDHEIIKV